MHVELTNLVPTSTSFVWLPWIEWLRGYCVVSHDFSHFLPILFTERSALSGRVFALFHFVCILFLYLYCVSIDSGATERILFCLNPPPPPKAISKIPIFQNSNFQKKTKKPKKNKKNNCARTLPHPLFPPWSVQNCFFVFFGFFVFFWKIGILENWNFGKLEFWIFWFPGICLKFSISLGSWQYSHFLSIPEQSLKSKDKNSQWFVH